MEHSLPVVVIDNGSNTTKAGIAGEITPSVEFPSLIGHRRSSSCWSQEAIPHHHDHHYNGGSQSKTSKLDYIGWDALGNKDRFALSYRRPLEWGQIVDWDDLEKIWYHTIYNEIGLLDPSSAQILLAEPSTAVTPGREREKKAQVIFETFGFSSMFLADEAVLSLASSGRHTGVVMDSGESVSRIVPVYEGHALHHTMRPPILSGGREITYNLKRILEERGGHFFLNCDDDLHLLCDIKERLGHVASFDKGHCHQQDNDPASKKMTTYKLPDGQILDIGVEGVHCPELIFQLSDSGLDGIQGCLHKTIMGCDEGIRKTLYRNIVLCGGNSMFKGFHERIKKEMKILAPPMMKAKVVGSRVGKHSVWIGGSIIASLSNFGRMCVSKKEYFDIGPRIVERKCF